MLTIRFLDWFRIVIGKPKAETTSVQDSDSGDRNNEIDLFNPFPQPVQVEITDVLDLHTIPPRDVKPVVEEYLEQAHRAGFRTVRLIHGKGIGVQREIVRAVLARTRFVVDWANAPPEAGGLGATIVRFEPPS